MTLLRRLGRWLVAVGLLVTGRRRRSPSRPLRRFGVPPEPLAREVGARRRAENVVLLLLGAAAVGGGGFVVFYVAYPDTQLLGLTLGLALALLGAACIVAGKAIVPQETAEEERGSHGDPEARRQVQGIVIESGEGISRRRLLIGAAGAAGVTLGAAAIVPVASLGPSVGESIYRTPWTRGRRIVDEEDNPISAEEVTEATFLSGFPEGGSKEELGAPIIIVRVSPEQLALAPEREAGAPEGILAFSKICPHAGCAISVYQTPLYEPVEPPNALVCPCHYSTFDPGKGGKLLFGPAGRDLPQLPLAIGTDRTLMAAGDFYDAIGPSYGGIRLRDEGDEE